jgi:heme-degrading monooxygenase HmoA
MITMSEVANLPEPPYYAVIFVSSTTDEDNGYAAMSEEMVTLAEQQPGFLGIESVRDMAGNGITVSYWTSEEAIASWQQHARHLTAQQKGRETWYETYTTRVCKVERAYGFTR